MRIHIPPPPPPFLDLTTDGGLAAVLPAQHQLPYENSDVNAWLFVAFSPNGTDRASVLSISAGVLTVDDSTVRLNEHEGATLGQVHYLAITACRKPGSTGAIASNTIGVRGQPLISCACDNTTDVITAAMHGLMNGDVVQFTGTLPTGLSLATDYIVRDRTEDTFKVTATLGGSAVNFTTNGSAVVCVPRARELCRLQVQSAAAGDEPVADYFRIPCSAGNRVWSDSATYPLTFEYLISDVDLEVRVLGVGEA